MSDVEKLFSQIHEAYDRLPKKQKKIADYISSNVQEVIFYSISELAAVLKTAKRRLCDVLKAWAIQGIPNSGSC